jgi:hypothetical protein
MRVVLHGVLAVILFKQDEDDEEAEDGCHEEEHGVMWFGAPRWPGSGV